MNHPAAPRALLHKTDLNPNEYLLSLLELAYQLQLLSKSDLDNIQSQIMDILKVQIMKYTGGASSSVKVETAQNLLTSILYCIDAYGLRLETPTEFIEDLRSRPVRELYLDGLACVESCFEETGHLFKAILSNRIQTKLIAYNSTLEAIPEFFSGYDARFNAHNTMADIDYPLAHDHMNIRGIFYLQQYLHKLNIENRFCAYFPSGEIEQLLYNYGRVYRINYTEFLLNIFEIVLTNAIFAIMLGKDPLTLLLSPKDGNMLNYQLQRTGSSHVSSLIDESIQALAAKLQIIDPDVIEYIRQCENDLASRVINGLQEGCLDKLVITDQVPVSEVTTTFTQGQVMEDGELRQFISQILASSDTGEKVELILSHTRSLTDFLDILDADCLFGEEYTVLFESMGHLELALLVRTIMADELRDADIPLKDRLTNLPQPENEWASELLRSILLMDSDRLSIIEGLVNQLSN